MVETALLIKIGLVIKGVVWGGYTVAGGYGVKTVFRYVRDYRESVANEKEWQ
jgi:hypothetical protein